MTHHWVNKKRNPSKNLALALGGVLLLGLLVFLGIANLRAYHNRQKLALQIDSLQKKIHDANQKNQDLKESISQEDNEAYIERVAREEMGLQKPGEKVVSFIMAKAEAPKP